MAARKPAPKPAPKPAAKKPSPYQARLAAAQAAAARQKARRQKISDAFAGIVESAGPLIASALDALRSPIFAAQILGQISESIDEQLTEDPGNTDAEQMATELRALLEQIDAIDLDALDESESPYS